MSSPPVPVGSYIPRHLGGGIWSEISPPAQFEKAAAEPDSSATSLIQMLKLSVCVDSAARNCEGI